MTTPNDTPAPAKKQILVLAADSAVTAWDRAFAPTLAQFPTLAGVEFVVRDSYADRAALVAETPALVALVPRLVGILVVVIDNRLGRVDEGMLGPFVERCAGLECVFGVNTGFDHVDVDYLSAHGLLYSNCPLNSTRLTADATVMLILQTLRAASHQEASLRAGRWRDLAVLGKDHRGLTLGIVGFGRIGGRVAEMLRFLGMTVVYNTRTPVADAASKGFTWQPLDRLLAEADVIALCCPLTPKTTHLVDAKAFARMKDGVFLVNTSRGGVVDEQALVDALASGKVARAGLDVYESEPHPHPALVASTRTTLLPHAAVAVDSLFGELAAEVLANVAAVVDTGKAVTMVNEREAGGGRAVSGGA